MTLNHQTKPFIAESISFCSLDKEEKIKIPAEPAKCQLKLITPERKPIQTTVQIEKKLPSAVEIKPSIIRQEKLADKVQVVLKPLQKEAPTPEVTILKPATIIPEKLVKEISHCPCKTENIEKKYFTTKLTRDR